MPTPDENLLLVWSLLQQKLEDGQVTGIDWNKIATRLGMDTTDAAKSRWKRLKADFQKKGFMDGEGPVILEAVQTPAKATKAPTTPKAKKTANPKARSAVEKKPAAKGRGKKATVAAEDEEVTKFEQKNEDSAEEEMKDEDAE